MNLDLKPFVILTKLVQLEAATSNWGYTKRDWDASVDAENGRWNKQRNDWIDEGNNWKSRNDDERSKKQQKHTISTLRNNYEQTTSRIEIPNCSKTGDGEMNAPDSDDRENQIQDKTFRPWESNELRIRLQSFCIQTLDSEDTVIVNQKRIGEDRSDHQQKLRSNKRNKRNNIVKVHVTHFRKPVTCGFVKLFRKSWMGETYNGYQ